MRRLIKTFFGSRLSVDKPTIVINVLTAVMFISALTLPLSCTKEPKEIKIGHISPLTGDAAVYGQWESQGIDLAVEEINSKGGILGRNIKVIHEDSEANPQKGVNAINKLIRMDKVPAIIGASASSVTLACAPIAEKNKVVLISAVSAAINISNAGDYIFRVFPSNAQEARKLVEIANYLKFITSAIIFINNDFGSELSKVTSDEFTKTGGKILFSEGYEQDSKDFRTLLIKVKDVSPEVIFLIGYPKDMSLLCKQAKELGIKKQFLAPDTFFAPEIIEWSEGTAEDVIFVTPAKGIENRWNEFSTKIKNKYEKEPNIATAMAYDAMYLIAESLKKGGTTGLKIKEALYQIKDYPGVTGDITFDKNGDVKERLIDIFVVKNSIFVKYNY